MFLVPITRKLRLAGVASKNGTEALRNEVIQQRRSRLTNQGLTLLERHHLMLVPRRQPAFPLVEHFANHFDCEWHATSHSFSAGLTKAPGLC